jgi:hypothetical protein
MVGVWPPASLSTVQNRIDTNADQAGVAGMARLNVDDTLATLPWLFRRRMVLPRQSLQAFSPDPAFGRPLDSFS